MPPILAFDMNGTLLDLAVLDPQFQQIFGSGHFRREWFMQMLQLAMASTITGYYNDFSQLGDAALTMLAERHSVQLSDGQRKDILSASRSMPAFPDVEPALRELRKSGLKLIVLTNSPSSSAEESLYKARLHGYFDAVLSVEAVQRFKPAPEVYRMAATKMGVAPTGLMLVAAHSWDTSGAIRAGCRGAFIRRPGEVLDPLGSSPEIVARDLGDFSGQLLAAERAA